MQCWDQNIYFCIVCIYVIRGNTTIIKWNLEYWDYKGNDYWDIICHGPEGTTRPHFPFLTHKSPHIFSRFQDPTSSSGAISLCPCKTTVKPLRSSPDFPYTVLGHPKMDLLANQYFSPVSAISHLQGGALYPGLGLSPLPFHPICSKSDSFFSKKKICAFWTIPLSSSF